MGCALDHVFHYLDSCAMDLTRTGHITTAADSFSQIGGIRTHVVKLCLLVVLLSCNLLTVASERDLRINASIGPVLDIKGQGDMLWLGTAEGLYRWDNVREGAPERVAVNTGAVSILQLHNNTLWIGSEQGLFRWDSPEKGLPQPVNVDTGPVNELYKLNRTLLIGAKNGLFLWQIGDEDSPRHIDVDDLNVTEFCRGKVNQVWIGSRKGLLLYEEGNGEPVFLPEVKDIPVTSLSDEGSELLIGTSRGLLRWDKIGGSKPDWVLPDVEVHSISKDGSRILISTKGRGLFRLDNVQAGQPELIDGRIGVIHKYFKSGTILWLAAGMGTRAGLYRWDSEKGGTPERVAAVNAGYIHNFYRSGGTLWIGAEKGLFQIEGLDTEWDAQLRITSTLPETINTDNNLLIQWQVGNFGRRTTPEQVQYRVIVKDADEQDVNIGQSELIGKPEITLPPLQEGKYTLYVQATDLNGKLATSPSIHFSVNGTQNNILSMLLKVGPLVFGAILLIVLSPRLISRLLQYEVWGIKQLAPAFYLTRLGRWKLYRRYRQKLRQAQDVKYSVEHYVDLPYESDSSETDSTKLSDLFAHLPLSKRVVVIADGGRGKSTLCHKLAQRCIDDHDLFGDKLLEPVVIDGLFYAGNLLNTITNVLKKSRAYVNETIVSAQLAAGRLLIIFDGFSEIREPYLNAPSSEDLPEFISQHPDTPFIFTSRSNLPPGVQEALGDVLTVRLLDLDDRTVRPFLNQYLTGGMQEVDALIKEVEARFPDLPRIPLMLKLIATVYKEKGRVPKDTAALFADYVGHILRSEATGIDVPEGLDYAICHLVRETYLKSGGDRGFTTHQGVELLDTIRDKLAAYEIKLSPIKLLRLLTRAGLYKEVGENRKFFHDSFESYFAAHALVEDVRAGRYELLKQCMGNDRLRETLRFLDEILADPSDKQKLARVAQGVGK